MNLIIYDDFGAQVATLDISIDHIISVDLNSNTVSTVIGDFTVAAESSASVAKRFQEISLGVVIPD